MQFSKIGNLVFKIGTCKLKPLKDVQKKYFYLKYKYLNLQGQAQALNLQGQAQSLNLQGQAQALNLQGQAQALNLQGQA